MTNQKSGQKGRRTLLGRKTTPPRVGKRPLKLVVTDRKQQAAAEHRRMGGR